MKRITQRSIGMSASTTSLCVNAIVITGSMLARMNSHVLTIGTRAFSGRMAPTTVERVISVRPLKPSLRLPRTSVAKSGMIPLQSAPTRRLVSGLI